MKRTIQSKLFIQITSCLALMFTLLFLILMGHEIFEIVQEGEPWAEEIGEITILLGLCLGLFLAMSGFLVYVLSRRVLHPLQHMVAIASEITQGGLHRRLSHPLPDDEVGMLATALNQAFDRYHTAIDHLAKFTSDASHQLRTPLTRMRSSGEICLRKERTPSDYQETILDMLNETEQLTKIVDQLLALSRLESSDVRKSFVRVDLPTTLQRLVEQFDLLAKDRNVTLHLSCDRPLNILGEPSLLAQAVGNLLDNSLCVTPEGGVVHLTAQTEDKDVVRISVSDSGPGVPQEYRTRIFDRFCRTPQTSHEGSGLGLAIAGDIAKLHGGTIHLRSGEAGATCFEITLPRV